MLFTSLEFLLFFFPVALGVYFFLPRRGGWRNYWLLLASLFFYAWGEPIFVLVMICSILLNYFAALHIEELGTGSWERKGLVVSGYRFQLCLSYLSSPFYAVLPLVFMIFCSVPCQRKR